MNRSYVKLIVIPNYLDRVNPVIYSSYGNSFSSYDEIIVNRVECRIFDGYTILYRDATFIRQDTCTIGENIIDLFTENLPGEVIDLEIIYHHYNKFDDECGAAVIKLDDFFTECDYEYLDYHSSDFIDYLVAHYDEESEEFDFDDNEQDEEDDEDEEDDSDDDDYDEDDDEEEDELDDDEDDYINDQMHYQLSLPKRRARRYGRSRLITDPNSKDSVKKHGVIISSNKNLKKKDSNVIYEFLKDFIPGKSSWMKQYRYIVLKRWIDTYVISKKSAKRISKDYKRRTGTTDKSHMTRDDAANITRRIFQQYDPFYDVNR